MSSRGENSATSSIEKTCSSCRETKPVAAFNRHPQMRDGRNPRCKVCLSAARRPAEREKYWADPESARARAVGKYRESSKLAPERYILAQLKQRCSNPKHKSYKDYGGRGITVSASFFGPGGFERFYAELGPRPSRHHSVERKENARGYEPGNIVWATTHEQGRNKRSNRLLTLGEVTLCLTDWGARAGIAPALIRGRIDRLGWSIERALTTPPHHKLRTSS